MKPNLFTNSRKSVQAAINLRAAMNEMQKLAGEALTGNQALKLAEDLLVTIEPIAALAPKPFLLTAPEGPAQAPKGPPPILKAIALVLGNHTLHVAQITKALQDKGWLPNTPRSIRYVSDILSRNSEGKGAKRFTWMRRGTYQVVRKTRRKLVFRTSP